MLPLNRRPSLKRIPTIIAIAALQIMVVAAFAAAAVSLSPRGERRVREAVTGDATAPRLAISHKHPLNVEPLFDDPTVVSDDELREVLDRVLPRFERTELQPNYVEHALRAWGGTIEFDDPEVMDGPELVDFLVDYGAQLSSWQRVPNAQPLIVERPDGIGINWGRAPGESVHHDHWLACLTEAGVPLDTPIYGMNRRGDVLEDALQEALRDFDPSERETEWSVMAFGFWLPPDHRGWVNRHGRQIDFDLLAEGLMRGHERFGVCGGTHRVYSLMVLLRLDDRYSILSPAMREMTYDHLRKIRDMITVSQYDDGHWGSDWPDGAPVGGLTFDEPKYRTVIATGHHLEWLAIAYPDLHPPRQAVRKAADWLVKTVRDTPHEELMSNYTFYSHVGNALALWRKTHPADAWPKLANGEPLSP